MGNERNTEEIVRDWFKNDTLHKDIKIEEQRSRNEDIKELLKEASKKGTGKPGYPEFIITFPSLMNTVIIVECKADLKNHNRKTGEKENPEKYAVDGVLHYAKFLKHRYNVIAIAVSGERSDNVKINQYLLFKNRGIEELKHKNLLTVYDYLQIFKEDKLADNLKDINLIRYASTLNKKLYGYSVPENERATIVSGVLIALQDKSFSKIYPDDKTPKRLVEDLLTAIKRVLDDNNLEEKTPILMGEYSKIQQSNKLAISDFIRDNKSGKDIKNTLLRDLIGDIHIKVFPFTKYEHIGFDILGQFYSEFISYVYGDKKLGLVLTPKHITELFVDIASVDENSIVYDNCCGTAGFLIAAMQKMIDCAGKKNKKIKKIKGEQLYGIESRSDMFTYACSNMMMRGDGKSHIYIGDSLSSSNIEKISKIKPDVGLLNPPYSTAVSELEFIYRNLECLRKNGTCVAIIPMSCVLAQNGSDYKWKIKLLEKHTLKAVFSMPDELFNPAASTVTAIVVFEAKNKHQKDYETYFGYWKDDGFEKRKNIGRVDAKKKWEDIKKLWLYNYKNKKEIKEHSVMKCVSSEDEWCAEAYLETDYSKITKEDYEKVLKEYVIYKLRYE